MLHKRDSTVERPDKEFFQVEEDCLGAKDYWQMVVHFNASELVLGDILTPQSEEGGKVIVYSSREFKWAEHNYSTSEQECCCNSSPSRKGCLNSTTIRLTFHRPWLKSLKLRTDTTQ
ncbi:uncharacterized protein LOC114451186 [Tachysurus ichikawai]